MFSLSLYAAFFALVNSLFPALWTAMGSRRVVQEEISQNRVKKNKNTCKQQIWYTSLRWASKYTCTFILIVCCSYSSLSSFRRIFVLFSVIYFLIINLLSTDLLDFFFLSQKVSSRLCPSGLLSLLLYTAMSCSLCTCAWARVQKSVGVFVLTHISVSPAYCKFSSKLLRAQEDFLSADKCHINSQTGTRTRHAWWEFMSTTVYSKCRYLPSLFQLLHAHTCRTIAFWGIGTKR